MKRALTLGIAISIGFVGVTTGIAHADTASDGRTYSERLIYDNGEDGRCHLNVYPATNHEDNPYRIELGTSLLCDHDAAFNRLTGKVTIVYPDGVRQVSKSLWVTGIRDGYELGFSTNAQCDAAYKGESVKVITVSTARSGIEGREVTSSARLRLVSNLTCGKIAG